MIINQETLSKYRMDWGVRVDHTQPLTDRQFSQALADAVKYYAVKFDINPTRAWIHQSQLSDQLALMAQSLGVKIITTLTAYNINHIMLGCDSPFILEVFDEKERKEDHGISNPEQNK